MMSPVTVGVPGLTQRFKQAILAISIGADLVRSRSFSISCLRNHTAKLTQLGRLEEFEEPLEAADYDSDKSSDDDDTEDATVDENRLCEESNDYDIAIYTYCHIF